AQTFSSASSCADKCRIEIPLKPPHGHGQNMPSGSARTRCLRYRPGKAKPLEKSGPCIHTRRRAPVSRQRRRLRVDCMPKTFFTQMIYRRAERAGKPPFGPGRGICASLPRHLFFHGFPTRIRLSPCRTDVVMDVVYSGCTRLVAVKRGNHIEISGTFQL